MDMGTVFAKTKRKRTKRLRGLNSPLYASIWPMVYVVRVFGFAPYEFSQDRLVPSNNYLIFSVIAATLYSYTLYVVCQKFASIKRHFMILDKTENLKVSDERKKIFGASWKKWMDREFIIHSSVRGSVGEKGRRNYCGVSFSPAGIIILDGELWGKILLGEKRKQKGKSTFERPDLHLQLTIF